MGPIVDPNTSLMSFILAPPIIHPIVLITHMLIK